jgi:hypothetical protein
MHIVTQVLGRLMARFLTVCTLMGTLLLQLVNSLRVRFTLIYQSVVTISNPLAKIKPSINRLVANLTIQVQLIKLGLINVLTKVGQLGQQLLTTVRQILQRVLNLLKRGN